ncbi:MAG TPA: SlyX family protein [Pseudomonas sp.]|nr:SlyX family protein [Pseudomonas sp.]HSX89717.1 SlyX family protein [Pseudomonas sp.]
MTMEERITELESRLAFQDDTIQALNDVLVAQQRVMERMQLQLVALAKRQQESSNQFDMTGDEAPPPHY